MIMETQGLLLREMQAGYAVHVISDCVTSYDLKKMPEMLAYYMKNGCEVKDLAFCMNIVSVC